MPIFFLTPISQARSSASTPRTKSCTKSIEKEDTSLINNEEKFTPEVVTPGEARKRFSKRRARMERAKAKRSKFLRRFDREGYGIFLADPSRVAFTGSRDNSSRNFTATVLGGRFCGFTDVHIIGGVTFRLKGEIVVTPVEAAYVCKRAEERVGRRAVVMALCGEKVPQDVAKHLAGLYVDGDPSKWPEFQHLAIGPGDDSMRLVENASVVYLLVLTILEAIEAKRNGTLGAYQLSKVVAVLGTRATMFRALMTQYFRVEDIPGLLEQEFFPPAGVVDEEVDQVAIGSTTRAGEMMLNTPWFKNLVNLTGIACASTWFGKLDGAPEALKAVMEALDPRALASRVHIVTLVVDTVKEFVAAIKRVIETRDFMAMFVPEELVAMRLETFDFRKKFGELQPEDRQEFVDAYSARLRLFVSQRRLEGEEISLVQLAKENVRWASEAILKDSPRDIPAFAFFLGPPQTGKTSTVAVVSRIALRMSHPKVSPGDGIVYANMEEKYIGDSVPTTAVVINVNDIQADTSEVPDGALSFDVFVQRVLDSTPLTLPNSRAEDKGAERRNVSLLTISSNSATLKGKFDTEKLLRRARIGFNYYVDVNKRLLREDFGDMSVEQFKATYQGDAAVWNKYAWMYPLTPVAHGKTLSFQSTNTLHGMQNLVGIDETGAFPVGELLPRFTKWYREDRERERKRRLYFEELCSAKIPAFAHIDGEKKTKCCEECNIEDIEVRKQSSVQVPIGPLFNVMCGGLAYVIGSLIINWRSWKEAFQDEEFMLFWMTVFKYHCMKYYFRAKRWWAGFKIQRFLRRVWEEHKAIFAIILAVAAAHWFVGSKGAASVGMALGGAFAHWRFGDKTSWPNLGETKEFTFPPADEFVNKVKPSVMRVGQYLPHTPGVAMDKIVERVKTSCGRAILSRWENGKEYCGEINVTLWNRAVFSIPAHVLWNENGKMFEEVAITLFDGEGEERTQYKFNKDDFFISPLKHDLALAVNVFSIPVKDISRHLVSNTVPGRFVATTWVPRLSQTFTGTTIVHPSGMLKDPVRQVNLPLVVLMGIEGAPGDCGSPLVFHAGNPGDAAIFGVTSVKLAGGTGFTPFSREMYEEALHALGITPLAAGCEFHVPPSAEPMGPLSPNSSLRWINPARKDMIVLGTSGSPGTFKTSFVETPLCPRVSPYLSVPMSPPKKLRMKKDGVAYDALVHSFSQNSRGGLNWAESMRSTNMYLRRVKHLFADAYVGPLSFEDALFGNPNIGLDPMNKDASNGPYCNEEGMKDKNHLFADGVLKREFRVAIDILVHELRNGEFRPVSCSITPKDEVRELEKVDVAKIRLFSVMDLHFNLVCRAYMFPLFKILLDNPHVSHMFAKINAASPAWHRLGQEMERGRCGDGDFKQFDFNHKSMAFLLFAYFMASLAKMAKYKNEDVVLVFNLCYAAAMQLCRYKCDYFYKMFGLPSGAYFTLMMNCFMNIVLHYTAFRKLVPEKKDKEFDKFLAVVGDDNIWSDPARDEGWNCVALRTVFGELGYPATSGSKDVSDQSLFVPLCKITFLKRRFLKENGIYYGPLSEDSMWKALCWQPKDGQSYTMDRLSNVLLMFQREAFLHRKPRYDEMMQRLESACEGIIDVPRIQYDDMQVEFEGGIFATYWSMAPIGIKNIEHRWRAYNTHTVVDCGPEERPPPRAIFDNVPGSDTIRTSVVRKHRAFLVFVTLCIYLMWRCTVYYIAESQNLNNQPVAVSPDSIAPNASVVAVTDVSSTRTGTTSFIRDEYTSFAEQPIQIFQDTWEPADNGPMHTLNDIVALWFTEAALTPLGGKISNFARFYAKIRIRVVVQGAPQLAGKYVLAFDPGRVKAEGTDFVATRRVNGPGPVNIQVVPHISIDPAVSQSYEIELPMATLSGFYSKTSTEGSYRFTAYVMNRLRSGTASSGTVSITMYMSFKDLIMDGMTAVGPTTKEGDGKVSGVMVAGAKLAKAVGSAFPTLGPTSTILEAGLSGAGSMLNWLGFAKPPLSDIGVTYLTRTADPYSHRSGATSAQVLGASQDHTLSISPEFGAGDLSHMALNGITQYEGLIQLDHQITTLLTPLSPLSFSIPVNPCLCLPLDEWYLTPLAGVAYPHMYWRADLTFTFEFVASTFQRATILIAWDPLKNTHASIPAFDTALSSLKNTTVQVCGTTVVSLKIPWRQRRAAAIVGGRRGVDAAGDATLDNGRIFMWVINPVVSNGSTDPIALNVYVSAEDGHWFTPTNKYINSATSKFEPVMQAVGPVFKEVSTVSFGDDGADPEVVTMQSFGDRSVVVKDVTSRHTFCFKADRFVATAGTLTNNPIRFANYPFCPTGTELSVPTSAPFNTTGTYGGNRGAMTHVAWFANAFNAMRGSLNWSANMRFNLETPASDSNYPCTFVMEHRNTGPYAMTTWVSQVGSNAVPEPLDVYNGDGYSYAVTNRNVVGRVDGIAPMLFPYPLVPTGTEFSTINDVIQLRPIDPPESSIDYCRTDVTVASGDDLTFVFFRGFPIILTVL